MPQKYWVLKKGISDKELDFIFAYFKVDSLKVLLVDVNCKNTSTGKIVYDLFSSLKENGHQSILAYGRGPLVNETDIFKISNTVEVYAHAFLTRLTGLTGYFSPFSTKKLLQLLDSFKPDVVHLHEMHGYYINIPPLMDYLKNNRIKTVWTFHCEFMYTGKCGHAYDCEKWKDVCGKCPLLGEYPSSWFFDFSQKMHMDKKKLFQGFENLTIVTPSEWLKNRVKQSFLRDMDIRVIHNGIDTENIFYPRDFEHLKRKHGITDEKVVLAVAPDLMSEIKGGRWIPKLAKRFKDRKAKFILIGVDKPQMVSGNNIIALGRTCDQHELAEYYSMADVFVICSKRENFPTTCLEALCCGTFVCGFDEGGTKETAPEGFGKFVPYGDIDSLSETVKFVLFGGNNKFSREKCSDTARNLYSKSQMCKEYLTIYSEIKVLD